MFTLPSTSNAWEPPSLPVLVHPSSHVSWAAVHRDGTEGEFADGASGGSRWGVKEVLSEERLVFPLPAP